MTRREFNHHVREERICENDLIDTLRRMNNHYLRLKQGQSDAMISLSLSREQHAQEIIFSFTFLQISLFIIH